jgi:glutathione S-transferase
MPTRAVLSYTPGSPFARMARVAIREWALPVEEAEVVFPPPAEVSALNPLGQVPVLTVDGQALYPTLIILERLWSMADRSGETTGETYDPARDRQLLLTILSAGDALVAATYQRWAGLGPVGPNVVGYDPAERNLGRVRATLDWLEANPRMAALGASITPPPVALACLLLWIEARGGLGWPVPPGLATIVAALDERESFRLTRPGAWRPRA